MVGIKKDDLIGVELGTPGSSHRQVTLLWGCVVRRGQLNAKAHLRHLSNQPWPVNLTTWSHCLRWSPEKPLGRKTWEARERTWPSWDPGCICWRGGRRTLWWTAVSLGTTLAPWGGASLTGPNTTRNYKVTKEKAAAAGGSLPGLFQLVPICRDTWGGGENQMATFPSYKTRKWNCEGPVR